MYHKKILKTKDKISEWQYLRKLIISGKKIILPEKWNISVRRLNFSLRKNNNYPWEMHFENVPRIEWKIFHFRKVLLSEIFKFLSEKKISENISPWEARVENRQKMEVFYAFFQNIILPGKFKFLSKKRNILSEKFLPKFD